MKETTEESDGLRILIALYRPRYLPKYKENWDDWWKELAPSRSLWKEYLKEKKIDWHEYASRYTCEIRNNPEAVKTLRTLSSFINDNRKKNHTQQQQLQQKQQLYNHYSQIQEYKVVTLLCHCIDDKYCHRSIVKGMLFEFT